jgi:hypothetical protein
MLQTASRQVATLIVILSLLSLPILPKASAQNAAGAAALAKALRTERNGWIYLHLEGSPDEIGYQHGWLLAREIEDALRVFKNYLQRVTARDWSFYRNAAREMFWKKIGDEYQREIQGIARGAYARGIRIDADDVLAMNAWMELAWYYVPSLNKARLDDPELHQSPPLACSAFVATGSYTQGGQIVMAHNNWIDYLIGRHWNIIVDLKPTAGHRILMDSFPGFIHSGDDFYVTDAGLMATETTISDFKGFDPAGLPEFYRIRKATQYADSIDDWLKVMMDRPNGGYANDWLIGDRKTGEIARLENGLKNNIVERTKDGYFVGSNFAVHEKTIKEETSFNPNDETNGCNARRRRWEGLMKENRGKIDVAMAKKFLADHYDAVRNRNSGSANTLCGHVELDDKGASSDWRAFYPAGASNAKATDSRLAAEMKLWAAAGHACGTDFKLDAYLKAHPEFEWQRELSGDMPSGAWTLFATTATLAAGDKAKGRSSVDTKVHGPYDVTNPQRRLPDNPLPGEQRSPIPGTTPRPPL